MPENIYLIDANILIRPSKEFYKFKIAPGYWGQFNKFAKQGFIKTIDLVGKEMLPRRTEASKDDIQLWYENDFKGEIIPTHQQNIVNEYQKINQYIYDSPKYNKNAFDEWFSRPDIADPWIIATAKVNDYTVVTFEGYLIYSGGTPFGSAKIPNVCEDFNVECIDLYTMMERLKIIL